MIALYPGAFKPPHRGHFEVVKGLLKGNHGGHIYTKDSATDAGTKALAGQPGKVEKITKVIVFPGGGERNGISKNESMAIWKIYAKYLPGIEVRDGEKNPMFAAKDYAAANEGEQFYAVTGLRDESDFKDLKRIATFKNVNNIQGLVIPAAKGASVRASDLRAAALSGNLDDLRDFFPKELTREELLSILKMLKDNIISEVMNQKIENLFEAMFCSDEAIKEENRYNADGYDEGDIKLMGDYILPIDKMVVLQAEEDTYNRGLLVTNNKDKSYDVAYWADDKTKPYPIGIEIDGREVSKDAKIIKFMFHPEMKEEVTETKAPNISHLHNYLNRLIPSGAHIIRDNSKLIIETEANLSKKLELKDYIGSLVEFMIDQGMKITPLPEIKLKQDEDNASNFFGKTAYYDPNTKEVVIYTTGRHPKDICRSFTHEMIHHIQNLEGRLGNISTSNTNEDDHLLEIEKEAYLLGNITFRNWEDSYKNKNKKVMAEGKYDKISNDLSSAIFKVFKNAYDKGKEVKDTFRIGPEPDADYEHSLEFDLNIYMKLSKDRYSVDGGANAGYDRDGDEIQPLINVVFELPKNIDWKEVSFDIKDVVRHEIEHLTQDGENLKQGKYIPDDQDLRDLIDNGLLDKDNYYKLPKEVDAMIQGMYFKAKKSKTPFKDVVNKYFDRAKVTTKERPIIKSLWNKRLSALGIKQRL